MANPPANLFSNMSQAADLAAMERRIREIDSKQASEADGNADDPVVTLCLFVSFFYFFCGQIGGNEAVPP